VTATRKPLTSLVVELVVIVATALALALGIQAFIVKPYRIPSGSMLPTLRINQRVLVNRIGTHFSSPRVGEIIVFHPPKNYDQGCANPTQGADRADQPGAQACDASQSKPSSQTFIKRVVGSAR
jgi:signal peptidase I